MKVHGQWAATGPASVFLPISFKEKWKGVLFHVWTTPHVHGFSLQLKYGPEEP